MVFSPCEFGNPRVRIEGEGAKSREEKGIYEIWIWTCDLDDQIVKWKRENVKSLEKEEELMGGLTKEIYEEKFKFIKI